MLGSTALNLLSLGATDELVAPATPGPTTARAQVLLSLWVDDVDAVCAELDRRGIDLLNGPLDRP